MPPVRVRRELQHLLLKLGCEPGLLPFHHGEDPLERESGMRPKLHCALSAQLDGPPVLAGGTMDCIAPCARSAQFAFGSTTPNAHHRPGPRRCGGRKVGELPLRQVNAAGGTENRQAPTRCFKPWGRAISRPSRHTKRSTISHSSAEPRSRRRTGRPTMSCASRRWAASSRATAGKRPREPRLMQLRLKLPAHRARRA